jgi:hypothetical protein
MMQDNLKSGFTLILQISLLLFGILLCLPLSFLELYGPRLLWVFFTGGLREEFGALGSGRMEEWWEGAWNWLLEWGWMSSAAVALMALLWGFVKTVMLMFLWMFGRDIDVMVTVDALKTTNKELKKQYGKIDIDKSKFPDNPAGNIHTHGGLQLNSFRMKWRI